MTLPLTLPAVEVLKVAHHGSADEGLGPYRALFTEAGQPRLSAAQSVATIPGWDRFASGAYPWERLVTHRVLLQDLPALFENPPRDLLKAAVTP